MNNLADPAFIVGSVGLTEHNARAKGQAVENADEHIHNTACGCNRAQRIFRPKIADYCRIHRIVQLLKEQTNRQWSSKGQIVFDNVALGHIHVFTCQCDSFFLLCKE